MKKVVLSMTALSMLLLVSCQGYKDQIARLQFQNDSIAQVNARISSEFDELLQMMDEIEAGFLQVEQTEAGLSQEDGERLKADIAQIVDILKENQAKIADLEKKYKSRGYTISQLRKTIDRLKAENEEKVAMITQLQQELAQRDAQIKELDASVASLNDKVSALSAESAEQQDVISAQDRVLNTVYYTVSKYKDLKANGVIIKGRALQGEVNNALFTEVDLRNLTSIPLNNVKRATILTAHPAGSYTLVKEGKRYTELAITNPAEFWSVSRYLVIRVK